MKSPPRPVQYFTADYLEQCRAISVTDRAKFVEEFRLMHGSKEVDTSLLISLRVPKRLLALFRQQAELHGTKYQTQIKVLMAEFCGWKI